MDTQAKIEIARELGFEIHDDLICFRASMMNPIMRMLPLSDGAPEERLCALVDNIEAALTFPDGRLDIDGLNNDWRVGYSWEVGKLPETVRAEHATNTYASRLEATVAALELAERLRDATAPKNRWRLRAEDAVVYFPAALEPAVSRCGGEYHEGAWWLETEDRPGEVELADLSARLDAQLCAGDIVFDVIEHEGRWYVKRNSVARNDVMRTVFKRHLRNKAPWFNTLPPRSWVDSHGTELDALVAALGYAEECRVLQASELAHDEEPPTIIESGRVSSSDVVEGFHVEQCEKSGRWYVGRTDGAYSEHRQDTSDYLRWGWDFDKTFQGDVTKYPIMHFATREEAVAHRDKLLRLVSTPAETMSERGKRPREAVEARIAAQMTTQLSGRIRVTIGGEEIPASSYVEDKPSFFPTEEAATHAARLLDSEWSRINKTDEQEAIMTANTTALATITELALPGLLRGALITVQRELVELAIPVVRRVARVEIKAWHRFAAAFSPKIKARLQLDRQIANLVVSVLVPCALYEAACRIEWIRKNENVMAFLRASIDAGCTEAGRLLAEPGLAFAKDGLTMLTRALKEEKRRGELRAASSRLLEDMTGRDGRVVTEAEREVIELARSIGGVA